MTPKELKNEYKDVPEIVNSPIEMKEANEPIHIYDGVIELRLQDTKIKLTGEILFGWFPSPGVRFSGTVKNSTTDLMRSIKSHEKFDLIINGLKFGQCFISNTTFGTTVNIEGLVSTEAVKGDKSIAVSKVIFAVPNLRDFFGLPVKKINDTDIKLSRSRLRFENDNYIIVLDKSNEYKNLKKSLQAKGGYVTLYSGEVSKKRGNFNFEEQQKLFHCFLTFLGFLNGRRCSPLFRQGIFNSRTIWCDYTSYLTDQYKFVKTWPQKHSIEGLDELWKEFYEKWQNEDDRDCLNTVIHWYVEANGNSGFVEGAIVMVQNALELLYNWLIVEKLEIIKDYDAINLAAANKIRLLLSQISLSKTIPTTLKETNQFIKKNINEYQDIDGPELFVKIRNAIVHSQAEKRKKLSSIPNRVKYEALQLGLLYLELSVLYILNFKGQYFNRCSGAKWSGDGEEKVPWLPT